MSYDKGLLLADLLRLSEMGSCYSLFVIWVFLAATVTGDEVESGRQKKGIVSGLPGQPTVSFAHYAGYVTVDDSHGRVLFYWFFEAQDKPSEKPLLLWLNGGPGCSSVGYGAAQELGPFRVNTNGSGLSLNPFAWNKVANLLFLESPVGVGFSYTNTSSDFQRLDDEFTAQDAYTFLVRWFNRFPEYKGNEFYMAGESYAGHYVPQLAELVYTRSKSQGSGINLKGFIVGNGITDDFYDWNGIVEYAWSHAVIGDELYQTIKKKCDFLVSDWGRQCSDLMDSVFDIYDLMDIYNIYAPKCLRNTSATVNKINKHSDRRRRSRFWYPGDGYDPCYEQYSIIYFNREDVQRALHVKPSKWNICRHFSFQSHRGLFVSSVGLLMFTSGCSDPVSDAYHSTVFSVLPIYRKLIRAGVRIWVYSGDIDGRVPVTSSKQSVRALNLKVKRKWQPWFQFKQVAGWTEEFEGLTYVTVRGAGHLVPLNKPTEALTLITAFLSNKSLPLEL